MAHERNEGRGSPGLPQEGVVQQLRGTRALQQEMEFWDVNLTKDSSLLHHATHSLSTGAFSKKTRLYSGFKNTYKKIRKKTRNSSLFMNSIM
jgi:hypothetical protein